MKIKITIPDNRFIPTIGKGPFLEPFEVDEETFNFLRLGGYKIKRYNKINNDFKLKTSEEDKEIKKNKVDIIENENTDTVENIIEDEIETSDENTDIVENVTTPDENTDSNEVDNTIEDEIETSDENSDDEVEEINYDSFSVKELKKMLDEKGIKFKYNDTKSILIEKIKNS